MLKNTVLYYFSPTGGTKKVGEIFAAAFAENVMAINLGERKTYDKQPNCDVVIFAAPVFGGRIPAPAIDSFKMLDGMGKKAITLAVYGTRAYEDALLELNNTAEESGFEIAASAALIARHSIVPVVGEGRPDIVDTADIQAFAKKVSEKLIKGDKSRVTVPGNVPYKAHMTVTATPVSASECNLCGVCAEVCPTGAVCVEKDSVSTDVKKCILCMACVSRCPNKGRILPPPMQESMNEKLSVLKNIRRENEYFL